MTTHKTSEFGRCNTCGSDLKTAGQARRQEFEEKSNQRIATELDSTYGHLRAVIENCKHSPTETIRHQLVGLLPEVQDMEPELKERLQAKGMGHLVERHEATVRANWAEYGYGEASDAA